MAMLPNRMTRELRTSARLFRMGAFDPAMSSFGSTEVGASFPGMFER
jgi:hypothetical protein